MLLALPCTAEVKLARLFSDGVVLQQQLAAPVWGTAAPDEQVTVSVAGKSATATADAAGNWRATLTGLPAGGPFELTVKGANTLTVKDVLVGEVWLASGQSNMQYRFSAHPEDYAADIQAADQPQIRMFTVPSVVPEQPLSDVAGGEWWSATPARVVGFSAVGYYFARELHEQLKVPIGIIHSSWGGTPAESWTSREALQADGRFAAMLQRWDQVLADYPNLMVKYEADRAVWKQAAEQAKAEGKPAPTAPRRPSGPDSPSLPGGIFRGKIAPLVGYGMRGAIWYQGESNAGRAAEYGYLFPLMIQDWRTRWGQGEFPFLFVQLANYMAPATEPVDQPWARLRESQAKTLALPQTGMAVAIDVGEEKDIHPRDKRSVGHRLALLARKQVYGQDVPASGPTFAGMTVDGDKAVLRFTNTDDGLQAKGGPLQQFAVAGEDHKFVWAEAAIVGETVVVRSPQVTKPVAVRYAWANNPAGANLVNGAGLPAAPFRTDDWEVGK